ncbi:MAG: methylenetetrahydrofolate reductase C-terminal domain-containing protein [Acidimicrobiaceae bacterium]|nr:methylenetetrahydrofolate reductase C-terminal domain-containing protein [Acidimicrobiaceae bacterium]
MSKLKGLGKRLDARFPKALNVAGSVLAPIEKLVKKPVFGCHMCGQCILHSTGMTCPMECPKNIRNGPCGGVGRNGECEVDHSMTCVWLKAVDRAGKGRWTDELYQGNPSVDWSLQGQSSWINTFAGRDHHERTAPQWQRVELRTKRTERDDEMRSGSRFERLLRDGHFVVTCEVNPRDSADATELIEYVRTLEGFVDAAHVSDNSFATPKMSGTIAAGLIEMQTGVETILHMTCRDRNRLMLQADVLGACATGVRNILCLGGDYPTLGDHPEAKPVFDLDSTGFIRILKKMRDEGTFDSGRELKAAPRVYIGGAVGPTAPPLEFRPHRMAKKLVAGADFITTQLMFDMDMFRDFMKRTVDLGLTEKTHILVGVGALPGPIAARMVDKTPGCIVPEHVIDRLEAAPKGKRRAEGVKIVVEQIQELQEIPGVSGVDIMDLMPDSWFPTAEIVEAAGLQDRPEPACNRSR